MAIFDGPTRPKKEDRMRKSRGLPLGEAILHYDAIFGRTEILGYKAPKDRSPTPKPKRPNKPWKHGKKR